jgi:hypothetical protein
MLACLSLIERTHALVGRSDGWLVKNLEALANPEALQHFHDRPELKSKPKVLIAAPSDPSLD